VARELARLCAGVRTEAAAVRPLARMGAAMNRQVAAVAEHLPNKKISFTVYRFFVTKQRTCNTGAMMLMRGMICNL